MVAQHGGKLHSGLAVWQTDRPLQADQTIHKTRLISLQETSNASFRPRLPILGPNTSSSIRLVHPALKLPL